MLRDGDRHHTLKQDIVAEPSTHSIAAGLLQQNSKAGNLQGGGLDCPNWWEYIFFLMYISTKCTEIQASWYYMQHFHSSLLATAFNSFISLYSFLDAFFLISIRFLLFALPSPALRAGKSFLLWLISRLAQWDEMPKDTFWAVHP